MSPKEKFSKKAFLREQKILFMQYVIYFGCFMLAVLSIDHILKEQYGLVAIKYSLAFFCLVSTIYIRRIPYKFYANFVTVVIALFFSFLSAVGYNYETPIFFSVVMIPLVAMIILPFRFAVGWFIYSIVFFLTIDYTGALALKYFGEQADSRSHTLVLLTGAALMMGIVLCAHYHKYMSLQMNKKLEERTQELMHLQASKDRFVAKINHELRTPLNAIRGITEIMRNPGTSPEEQLELIDSMDQSSEFLVNLVNDLLDLSKYDAGKIRLQNVPFNLYDNLESSVNSLKFMAIEKGLELVVDLDNSLNGYAKGDPLRLTQIVVNLLSNAIKYTDNGHIQFKAWLTKSAGNDGEDWNLNLRIKDSGRGIHKDDYEKIFKPYEQISSGGNLIGGTGLGLTIVKSIVDSMSGSIHFDSKINQGTSFNLKLPVQKVNEEKPNEDVDIDTDDASAFALNILLCEDNELNNFITQRIVENNLPNASVTIAENGQKGLDLFRELHPDLVLMDLGLPIMNGYECVRRIREYERLNNHSPCPILAYTANVTQEIIEECKKVGFNDFLPKPLDSKKLIKKINEWNATVPK